MPINHARSLHLASLALSLGCASARPNITTHAPMAVTRVVLFQNGLGYFERRGTTGSGVELIARRDHLDDVLKSLAVIDRSGGRVASVRVLPTPARADAVTLRLGLAGPERHDLSVSYMTEVSGWRPSYRVVMGAGGHVRLQGFAVIDNHTGEPWRNVSLGLSTATPISFRYALHSERSAHRAQFNSDGRLVVETPSPLGQQVNVFNAAQLLPQNALDLNNNDNNIQRAYNVAQRGMPQDSNRAGRMVGNEMQPTPPPADPSNASRSLEDSWASLPPREDAAGFTMEAPAHLDLDVGESAMVPFVDQTTDGEAVLLYRPSSGTGPSASRPYRAVLFTNPLDAPLLTGPVTVYDEGAFVGDGVTGSVPSHAHAFVAHALDPDVHIQRAASAEDDEVQVTAAHAGLLSVRMQSVQRSAFTIDAAAPWNNRIFLHIPAVAGFRPRALPTGAVEAPNGYFIPVARGTSHATASLDLIQERTTEVHIETDPMHPHIPALLEYLRRAHGVEGTVALLQQIHERTTVLRDQRVTLEEDLAAHQHALSERREALAALRDVSSNGAIRAHIGQSVAEGVAAVDALTRRVVANNNEALTLREQWYALTRALAV